MNHFFVVCWTHFSECYNKWYSLEFYGAKYFKDDEKELDLFDAFKTTMNTIEHRRQTSHIANIIPVIKLQLD